MATRTSLDDLPVPVLCRIVELLAQVEIHRAGHWTFVDGLPPERHSEYSAITLLSRRYVAIGRQGMLSCIRINSKNYERFGQLIRLPDHARFVQRVELHLWDTMSDATLASIAQTLCLLPEFRQLVIDSTEPAFTRFMAQRRDLPAFRAKSIEIRLEDRRMHGPPLTEEEEDTGNEAIATFIEQDLHSAARLRLRSGRLLLAPFEFEAPALSLTSLDLVDGISGAASNVSLAELANRATNLRQLSFQRGQHFLEALNLGTAARLEKLYIMDDRESRDSAMRSLAAFDGLGELKLGWTHLTPQLLHSVSPSVETLDIDHTAPTACLVSYQNLASSIRGGAMPGLRSVHVDVQYIDALIDEDDEEQMIATGVLSIYHQVVLTVIDVKMACKTRDIKARVFTGDTALDFDGMPTSDMTDDSITPDNFAAFARRYISYRMSGY